jgi:hypothetical protein
LLKYVNKMFVKLLCCIFVLNNNKMQKYEVIIDDHEDENGLFYVYNNETKKIVSKCYKYSRYACNLQDKLELGY